MVSNHIPRARFFIPFALVFLFQTAPLLWMDSPINDEAWELTNGYCYWTQGEVRAQRIFCHPPFSFALQALPLLALDLKAPPKGLDEENRAFAFCDILNKDKIGRMLSLARSMTLLLSVALGFLIFLATRPYGSLMCGVSLWLWAFDPTFLAWSPTVKTDVPGAFFFLAAALLFREARRSGRTLHYAAWGLVTGMACTAKLTCLALFPAFLMLEWLHRSSPKVFAKRWAWGTGTFLLWIWILYLPGYWEYAFPWTPLQEWIQKIYDLTHIRGMMHGTFFMGRTHAIPSALYLACAYFLKSPLPFLLLLGVGLTLLLLRRIKDATFLWMFPFFLYIELGCATSESMRYLLPAEPFLILLAAQAVVWFYKLTTFSSNRFRTGVILLLLFTQALSVSLSFPHHLGYFNELIRPERRKHLLGGYDLDVGQDLKRLTQTAHQNGWTRIKLADIGTTDPSLYGLRWERWTEKDLERPQPGYVYVTTVSFLQSAPAYYPQTYPIAMSWLRRLPPSGTIGDTLIYHVIPGIISGPDRSKVLDSVPYLRIPSPPTP